MLMGTAEVIPGVSGGTMALIAGVYEALVGALSSLVSVGLALLRLDWTAARRHWTAVPWGLLLPLLGGMAGMVVLGARLIPGLLEAHPARMRGLFFGLVGASLFIPALRIQHLTAPRFLLGLVCAGLAFTSTGLPVLEASNPGPVRVFCSAAIAICAMILPGVSGAFLLEVLGVYTPTLQALNTFEAGYVLTFGAGAAVGLAVFAKLLDRLLTHYHDATMAALVGLIAGALRALWPYTEGTALRLPAPGEPVGSVAGLAVLGFAAVLGLLWWSRRPDAAPSHASG
jgi:putative membrane protein